MANSRPTKRKKNAPKVGGTSKVYQKLKKDGNSHLVQHLSDLEHYDRTHVDGINKDEFQLRWSKEEKLGLRKRQGYEVVDDADVTVSAPGGSAHWAGEGKDGDKAKGGLVLTKVPKELFDARQARKQEIRDQENENAEAALRGEMTSGGKGVVPTLDDDDKFIKELQR